LVKKIWNNTIDKQNYIFVAMLDLDKFKNINDTYGHKAGDIVLKTFTKTVEDNLEDNDIFGRLGGEEFALVIRSRNEKSMIIAINKPTKILL
jgi:diguanylate cyclase (GGDEF)-like protein